MSKTKRNKKPLKETDKRNHTSSFWIKNKNIIIFAGLLVLISVIFTLLQPAISNKIKSDPFLSEQYENVVERLNQKSYVWLFIVTFLGALVIFPLATEVIFAFYIATGANPIYAIIGSLLGTMFGRIANYWLGYSFSNYVTKRLIKEHVKDFNKKFSKWGTSLILIGHAIPFFPLEPLGTFLGSIKYDFWKFVLYNFMGEVIKLILFVLFMEYFFSYSIAFLTFNFFDFVKALFAMSPKPF